MATTDSLSLIWEVQEQITNIGAACQRRGRARVLI
jgi:hypothetical protein